MFPTHDGKFIQFVAQNKQRCFTGKDDEALLQQMAPQASLFQHVPIMRISNTSTNININTKPIQYKLTSHSNADLDGMATRFLCRFSNGEETLSVFNFSYEWASRRRRLKEMFSKHGRDNQKPHLSQLLFQCPVPPSLIEAVQSGSSVLNDYATLFLDLIPIRTPARYGPPDELLPPYYKDFESKNMPFDAVVEWGDQHILPAIDDSGRWENIPICKPSHLTYEQDNKDQNDHPMAFLKNTTSAVKQHRVVACIWASAGYSTRGNKFTIQDGKRRLLEWIVHHKNIGVEHVYVYDNSGAFASKNSSLDSVAKLFTDHVTLIPWPARTCNNHMDSVGERSSQYAAEASCRLRFGPQADWIAQVSKKGVILFTYFLVLFFSTTISSLILTNT